MADRNDSLADSSLRFFGEMTAANAHEIKNALAVINENAGLLEDLVALADNGASLDRDRLMKLAGTIKHQVTRADHIAKSSNRFSHSVDRGHQAADLRKALSLIADMATRYANLRDVELDLVLDTVSVILPVKPFTLLHLLWICLHDAIKACAPGQVLSMPRRCGSQFKSSKTIVKLEDLYNDRKSIAGR